MSIDQRLAEKIVPIIASEFMNDDDKAQERDAIAKIIEAEIRPLVETINTKAALIPCKLTYRANDLQRAYELAMEIVSLTAEAIAAVNEEVG